MSAPGKLLVVWTLTLESLSHQDVVNLVVMLPAWAMLCLPSGWFRGPVVFVSIRMLKVAKSRSLRPLSFVSELL